MTAAARVSRFFSAAALRFDLGGKLAHALCVLLGRLLRGSVLCGRVVLLDKHLQLVHKLLRGLVLVSHFLNLPALGDCQCCAGFCQRVLTARKLLARLLNHSVEQVSC